MLWCISFSVFLRDRHLVLDSEQAYPEILGELRDHSIHKEGVFDEHDEDEEDIQADQGGITGYQVSRIGDKKGCIGNWLPVKVGKRDLSGGRDI